MPTIRFTTHYQVKAHAGPSYRAGDTLECSEATAKHFTSREVAELITDRLAESPEPRPEPARGRRRKKP
jgi:hypothetical protein